MRRYNASSNLFFKEREPSTIYEVLVRTLSVTSNLMLKFLECVLNAILRVLQDAIEDDNNNVQSVCKFLQ